MGCDPRSERSMIARRRWVSVTLPSGLRQVPDPSGPRQLIRRPILSTSSGSAVAPRPYAKMPPIPHIVRLPATRHRAVGRPFDWARHIGLEAWLIVVQYDYRRTIQCIDPYRPPELFWQTLFESR